MSQIAGRLGLASGLRRWEGFELLLPDQVLRFHAGVDEFRSGVTWQGNVYLPWSLQGSSFGTNGDGAPARPKLVVGNFGGAVSALCRKYDNLLGVRLVRRQTLVDYLDAVNFVAGNLRANPHEEYPPETWVITRHVNELPESVEFELGSPLDVSGVMLPGRQAIATTCTFGYRGERCGYVGGPVADQYDRLTNDPACDACSHTISGCKLRFGNGQLPIGCYPGLAKIPRV